ncbi:hypothetical protein OK349_04815 [Sphingomonas sp. BT-65]|uniref:FAD-binding protein n=1 Tax=Sphingomonas sp. BT-65 TaxID=2989821 RepID=UPI0022357908|nr:FAD-binding protein [Sphingomonas sp. BT-65]MCW4461019.1 hypothetical protein [Sphingomonas sp. BT-65]
MPSISYDSLAAWSNYHLTLGGTVDPNPIPSMTIESLGRFHAADCGGMTGLERFAATAGPLFEHLGKLAKMLDPKPPLQPRSFAAGMTGRGWSFSGLIGTAVSQLQCDGLAGTGTLGDAEWNPGCCVPVDRIALTSGGTRLRELVRWAERHNLTIRTSGTHLGATIAGGAGTASHGSRLGFGGIQDMVLGMHLITGDREHVWIERKSCPVLSQAGLDRLAIPGANLRVVRDDDQFEDALIHLGGMGIVNGMAIELVPNQLLALMQRTARLEPAWLEEIGRGEFDKAAARLRCKTAPEFYEVTLNPHAPFDDEATHMMYFPRETSPLLPPGDAGIVRPSDAIGQLGEWLTRFVATHHDEQPELDGLFDPGDPPRSIIRTLRMLLGGPDSVFAYYRAKGKFEPNVSDFDPEDPKRRGYYWSGLHADEITGDVPGALYNASYAIPLDRVAAAVPVICKAVAQLDPSFVFSLRFVARPAGTLAFTRFDHNAVIEIDGLSPLICKLAAGKLDADTPNPEEILRALLALEQTLEKGALAVRAALDAAGIPYSMHWAKLGELDKAKVYADFGHPLEQDSLIRRWRATRDELLSPLGKRLFWNERLVSLGLLDRPPRSS